MAGSFRLGSGIGGKPVDKCVDRGIGVGMDRLMDWIGLDCLAGHEMKHLCRRCEEKMPAGLKSWCVCREDRYWS